MKRITVEMLCMIVSSDGFPVGYNGEEFGKGAPLFEWEKRRVSANKFCAKDLSIPTRRTVQYRNVDTADALYCNCHGKMRLMQ